MATTRGTAKEAEKEHAPPAGSAPGDGKAEQQAAAQDPALCPACYPDGWPERSTSTWCDHEGLRTRELPRQDPAKAS